MQSPHPWHKFGSTMAGSSPSMRKMTFRWHAFAALHVGHFWHFFGSMYAFGIWHIHELSLFMFEFYGVNVN